MRAGRSPQDDKRLSYARDRRNDYGEHDKSSRKNIARSKKTPNRANRRLATTLLRAAVGLPDPQIADAAEQRLAGKRPKSWRKHPDAPLAAVVADRLRRRVRLGIDDPDRANLRLHRIQASSGLDIVAGQRWRR
jgi:hypothetical protein